MELYKIFKELLNEATPIEIYEKFYKSIPDSIFIKIVSSDPQSVVVPSLNDDVNLRVKRMGKFSKLLLSLYMKNNLKIEDLPKAKDYLTLIYKHNASIDVNKIKQLGDLYELVKRYIALNDSSLSNILSTLSETDYKLLFNGNDWVIYQPLTEIGSCYLGVNTQWCTTWGPHSLDPKNKDKTNYFDHYNKTGVLYIIINKKNENDKYQFHFEGKQFMNPGDNQIDTSNFLYKNVEVKNFFFPSLVTKVEDTDLIDSQMKKMDLLGDNDILTLSKILFADKINNNKLCYDLLNKNEEEIEQQIVDDDFKNVSFEGNRIVFNGFSIGSELDELHTTITAYEQDINNSYDAIYDDVKSQINDNNYDENNESVLVPFFKKYYEENIVKINEDLGIFNYQSFEKYYLSDFIKDSNIEQTYCEKYADINYPTYQSEVQNELNNITKYINIDSDYGRTHEVKLNLTFFVQFLLIRGIMKIENNLEQLIDDFISFKNISSEYNYEIMYHINYKDVKWSDMESDVEKYFDDLIDEIEFPMECLELRKKFDQIYSGLFKNKEVFENEHVYVKISSGVDCENGSVKIEYKNKDTDETFGGDVKVDSLASYVTNYKLFESFVRFKKIIK